jgi:hypothetical protein
MYVGCNVITSGAGRWEQLQAQLKHATSALALCGAGHMKWRRQPDCALTVAYTELPATRNGIVVRTGWRGPGAMLRRSSCWQRLDNTVKHGG